MLRLSADKAARNKSSSQQRGFGQRSSRLSRGEVVTRAEASRQVVAKRSRRCSEPDEEDERSEEEGDVNGNAQRIYTIGEEAQLGTQGKRTKQTTSPALLRVHTDIDEVYQTDLFKNGHVTFHKQITPLYDTDGPQARGGCPPRPKGVALSVDITDVAYGTIIFRLDFPQYYPHIPPTVFMHESQSCQELQDFVGNDPLINWDDRSVHLSMLEVPNWNPAIHGICQILVRLHRMLLFFAGCLHSRDDIDSDEYEPIRSDRSKFPSSSTKLHTGRSIMRNTSMMSESSEQDELAHHHGYSASGGGGGGGEIIGMFGSEATQTPDNHVKKRSK